MTKSRMKPALLLVILAAMVFVMVIAGASGALIPQTTVAVKPIEPKFFPPVLTAAPPAPCDKGCECLSQQAALANKSQYCGGKQSVCGYEQSAKGLTPEYCYQTSLPVTTTPAPVTVVSMPETLQVVAPLIRTVSSLESPARITPLSGITVPPTPEGDIMLERIQPVQVVYGEESLVKGKGTAFRVRIRSTFPYPVDTRLRLNLSDSQWFRTWKTGHHMLGFPPDYHYPEIWGPVTIPANADNFEVMLPYIPESQITMTGSDPGRVLEGRGVGGIYGPDVRMLPMPTADRVQVTAVLDPEHTVRETHEDNNALTSPWYDVETTKDVRIYYAIHAGGDIPGKSEVLANIEGTRVICPTDGESRSFSQVCRQARDHAKRTTEYILGVGPIADGKIEYSVDCTVRNEATYGDGDYWGTILAMARSEYYDYVISLEPCDCCGGCGIGSSICGIGMRGPANNGAHELLGHGIQEIVYECYAPDETDVDRTYCGASEGFWVNRWLPYAYGEWGRYGPTYYMDSTGTVESRWQRVTQPRRESDGSMLNGGYNQLLGMMADAGDPKVILVRGMAYRNGTVQVKPFMILDNGTVDLESGSAGAYKIVLKDGSGKILDTLGFNLSFVRMTAAGREELESMPFVCLIEWKDGTKSIEIQDPAGTVKASRRISANPPSVTITRPKGGEVWEQGKAYPVTWEAGDQDGDALSYSVSLSSDNGTTWTPLVIDLRNTSYSFSAADLNPGDGYLFRVRATDGVLTAEDLTDGAVRIIGTPATPAGNYPAAFCGVLAALVIIGLYSRKKN